jgi:hypothetical protein
MTPKSLCTCLFNISFSLINFCSGVAICEVSVSSHPPLSLIWISLSTHIFSTIFTCLLCARVIVCSPFPLSHIRNSKTLIHRFRRLRQIGSFRNFSRPGNEIRGQWGSRVSPENPSFPNAAVRGQPDSSQ